MTSTPLINKATTTPLITKRGWRVVAHADRLQPYTVWHGKYVEYFAATEQEAYDFVMRAPSGKAAA